MGAPIDLGQARGFRCGDLVIDPAAREIRGPARSVMLEPRVMQLLVALAEAEGSVVSRERLMERCWGNVVVGDDSLNRAIAGLRRTLAESGSRTVAVLTVPKVGYRLGIKAGAEVGEALPAANDRTDAGPSRRGMMAAVAAVAVGGIAGAGGWLLLRSGAGPGAETELARARQLLLLNRYGSEGEARALLERVVTADPSNARGWGLLAVAWEQIAGTAVPETLVEAERQARDAAARALALDRLQGDAQAALSLLEPLFGAWMVTDERLRRVLEVAPDNGFAQQGMVNLLMAGGRLREARILAEAAGAAHPDSASIRTARIQLAWAHEGPDAALRLAETFDASSVRVAVLPWLLATSGRHAQSEAELAEIEVRQRAPSRILKAQRLTARALGTGTSEDREAAREALLPLGAIGGETYNLSIGGLAGLGFVDDAFAVAERWYAGARTGGGSPEARARRHRTSTRILFLPITEPMRADDRFVPLCDRIGLVGYWRQRALRADALADRLLPL